ncbi:hypothetical protein AURDEDRAFT_116134 [Auricularia subglabra TFB-10046 SS5]|nr:hypothetical protein AURDEDRAFT_116134 [Auricularia subglabra TFB-10046 SS5]
MSVLADRVPSQKPITLYPPRTTSKQPAHTDAPPPPEWLAGTWHVTHSTLPMWRSKRNVRITYTILPGAPPRLDDLVEYQSLTSNGVKIVRGIDTASARGGAAWDWRGKGWLAIASSRWEVLGHGEEGEEGRQWVVTYFAKTLFTPAGIDLYSRHPGGLRAETVDAVKAALAGIADEEIQMLAQGLFEVRMD